jgi:hypothetical protein
MVREGVRLATEGGGGEGGEGGRQTIAVMPSSFLEKMY